MTHENAIFLCYRREDSNAATHALAVRLKQAFGEKTVFWDHKDFHSGDSWRQKTRDVIAQAKAVIVVMNKDWLTIGQKRLIDAQDPVRQELELAAANENCTIIPVTIDGTRSPGQKDLDSFPDEARKDSNLLELLAKLFEKTRLKIEFNPQHFEADVQALVGRLYHISDIDPVGSATGTVIGGLAVLRPWSLLHGPRKTASYKNASDLWILQPKHRAIPLIGRDEDLRSLEEWMQSDACISARLIVGRAGSGKTRLGFEFLWQVFAEHSEHWDAGTISAESLRNFADWHLWTWRRNTVLMIDYAVAVSETMRTLFLALAQKAGDPNLPRLRILLVEREASAESGWFHDLLTVEGSYGGGPVQELFDPPAPVAMQTLGTLEQRRTILAETLKKVHAECGAPQITIPALGQFPSFESALQNERWNDPLYLMMAALVAARAKENQNVDPGETLLLQALSLGRIDLANAVVAHEKRRLHAYVEDANHQGGRFLISHAAMCVTMCSGRTAEQLLELATSECAALAREWPGGAGNLATTLANAFPDGDQGASAIQPDIIAEAFMIEMLLRQSLSVDQQNQVVLRNAKRNTAGVASILFHAFQNFASDNLSIKGLLRWIQALVASGLNENTDWLTAIEPVLPHSSIELRILSATVTQSLYDQLRSSLNMEEPFANASIARLANNLSIRLNYVGRHKEALKAAQEAAEHYRQLTKTHPSAFTADLAMSLNNLAAMLSSVGRQEEGLEVAIEAVDLRRQLAKANPDAFTPNLAGSLNNLAIRLSSIGRREEALKAAREATELNRQLTMANPDAFAPDLAMSLNNLANNLSEIGHREEALNAAQEATQLNHQLTIANPDAFMPDLAMSLNTLANRLSDVGRREEALKAAMEAVDLRRQLTKVSPDAFTPDLAMSLNTLSNRLNDIGRREEALKAAMEAVDLRRQLAKASPNIFTPDLATSLGALGKVFETNMRLTDAMESFGKGIWALLPAFQRVPQAFAPLMGGLARDYMGMCQKLSIEPDMDLLTPVIEILQRLNPPEQGMDDVD